LVFRFKKRQKIVEQYQIPPSSRWCRAIRGGGYQDRGGVRVIDYRDELNLQQGLPEAIRDELQKCPETGSGKRRVFRWIFYMVNRLLPYCNSSKIFKLLHDATSDCGREQSMYGATTFNSELFAAAHLMIADTLHSSDPKCKAALESAIKMTTATRFQRVHGKGKEAMNGLQPFWFLTVSLNDDGDGLSLLPRPTGSMEDKMMLFQVVRPAILPSTREEVQSVFIPKLEKEIPALIDYLLSEHVVPEDLRTDRAGILPYQNPDLVAEIVGESREAIVCNHLYTVYFAGCDDKTEKKTFTAHQIFSALDGHERISRSLARMRITESTIGRILTAIWNRPIADAPILLVKRKSGKLVYDISCNLDQSETGLDLLRAKMQLASF
jgi:hypothetical protein